MVEVLPAGEAYPGEVRFVEEGPILLVALGVRESELPAVESAVRVTFVRKDGLYEEQGAITTVVDSAEALVQVKLSGEASRTQRRDFVRRDASLNAELEWNDYRMRCVTKDVSGGGVSLLFVELPPVAEGMQFGLAINVPDGRLPIRALCRTKYVREVLRGSRWLAGSQFVDIADEDRQRLVRFVFRLELSQKRPRS